jgi:preprotein translocase subunit SecG
MNQNFFSIVQIVLGVLLMFLILLQSKGTGLGSTFGADAGFYRTKRGTEKILFVLTIIISSLFLVTSIVRVLL